MRVTHPFLSVLSLLTYSWTFSSLRNSLRSLPTARKPAMFPCTNALFNSEAAASVSNHVSPASYQHAKGELSTSVPSNGKLCLYGCGYGCTVTSFAFLGIHRDVSQFSDSPSWLNMISIKSLCSGHRMKDKKGVR